jgi:hypothetical protein
MDCAQAALMYSEEDARIIADAAEEIEYLRARVEVLEIDAARYQWLRSRRKMRLETSNDTWFRHDQKFKASHDLAANGTQYARYETLDQTIDAAMKEDKP